MNAFGDRYLVVWVTRVVCGIDKGTICEFEDASAHDSEVVEVVFGGLNTHVGTMFRSS